MYRREGWHRLWPPAVLRGKVRIDRRGDFDYTRGERTNLCGRGSQGRTAREGRGGPRGRPQNDVRCTHGEEEIGMKVAGGRSVLEGIAIGPLHWFQPQRVQIPERSARTPEEELERLEQARRRAQAQLGGLYEKARKEAGADSAAIFQIHQMMLDDEDFLAAVRDPIRSRGVSAEYAVQAAGEHFAATLAAMEDAYMQARADDVRDVARRVVLLLAGEEERPVLRERSSPPLSLPAYKKPRAPLRRRARVR